MATPAAVINVLPRVGSTTALYFTVIDNSAALNEATITAVSILYGNINLIDNTLFIPIDNNPIALLVTATYDTVSYINILYTKAVKQNIVPNNYQRLVQKIPYGIFTDIDGEIIGDDMMARAKMANDYYQQYFQVIGQVFSNHYSPQLELEYNNTVGLLSNSTYPDQLFQLLATLSTVHLNSYDLELFISRYIYYRLGSISAVYINDHIDPDTGYWILGEPGSTELDSTTILAPGTYQPTIKNLDWLIFNADDFTDEFKEEIRNLVIRISRADIGNTVDFTSIIDPVDADFTLIGATYPLDPRLIYDKCIQYIGDTDFPLNIIGYQKNF